MRSAKVGPSSLPSSSSSASTSVVRPPILSCSINTRQSARCTYRAPRCIRWSGCVRRIIPEILTRSLATSRRDFGDFLRGLFCAPFLLVLSDFQGFVCEGREPLKCPLAEQTPGGIENSVPPPDPDAAPLPFCNGGHKGQTGEHEEEEEGNINEWPTNFSAAAITFDT